MKINHKSKLLIFGGAGSLGNSLVDFYRGKVEEIYIASRDEAKHWEIKNKFKNTPISLDEKVKTNLHTVICDVRDLNRVKQILREVNPEYIIIAQALKQVDVCEEQPSESINTNIIGVKNIIDSIEEQSFFPMNNIQKVCFVSTDKACSPINVYGMCKSISERVVLATAKKSKIEYVVTRYGNVVSSKGSIIPLFEKQSQIADAFTVTDPRMTRFMMLLSEAVSLIDLSLNFGNSGELWIPKLNSFKVSDLADFFSKRYNKPTKIIGPRPGEKIHEILINEIESVKMTEKNGQYVISNDVVNNNPIFEEYSSRDFVLSKEVLEKRLTQFLSEGTYDI